jgi:HAD superfamily hydrolase (TIGR01490 family)
MHLALFDLDHTLIPFDSGITWLRLLIRAGALPPQAVDDYIAEARRYVGGTLDIRRLHRATVGALREATPAQFAACQALHAQAVAERVAREAAAMHALVRRHQDAGDLCVLVTATADFVAAPYALAFGLEHVIATDALRLANGVPGGEVRGTPAYREHKVTRVGAWLGRRTPPATLADCTRSWFYSDSINDLALLSAVTDPVVVRPDPALRAHARGAGWRVLDADAARG